jgi:F-box protein 9
LTHIFTELAVLDVADFVRLSLVCKRFAYLVATESQVWRRVCAGAEFGFQGMHYHWQTGIAWEALEDEVEETEEGEIISMAELAQKRQEESLATTLALFPDYGSSWKSMFRNRPRIRFNGCYISTVNYLRSGQASVNQVTWGSPVHIITYYRYLRFFRDGTVISLLTTAEPGDIVHHLTKELLETHFKGDTTHPSAIVSKNGLKGRWRLSTSLDNPEAPPKECDGELFIETEGATDKYNYRMDLTLKSAGKGARNNKLIWKGFYSYNKLTDDWGTFGLKNDKPYFFSRVKSYGVRGA